MSTIPRIPDLQAVYLVVTQGGTPVAMTKDEDLALRLAVRCGDWICTANVDAETWLKMGVEVRGKPTS